MNSEESPNLEQINSSEVDYERKEEVFRSDIQEQIARVSITSSAAELKQETNNNNLEVESVEVVNCVNDNQVEDLEDSENDESCSSSCSSSDDDETDDENEGLKKKKEKSEVEMEEGEIRRRDQVFASTDDDDDDDKGPIRSKNEVKDLPPVPLVTVTIQPHHQTLPVGVVLSIMGSQVIVEGAEVHNPLSEGSILWITESRSPLGVVDEIFGPVKNPYYIVRYNSETEIPTGIQQGSSISFVPEFADYVLNNSNLYKKGYDASGENDEECSEEVEFSDDEKEAEYKRMMKMAKRGSCGEKNTRMKKDKKSRNRGGNLKSDQPPSSCVPNHGPAGGPNHGPTGGPNHGPNNGPASGPYAFPQAPNIPSGAWPYGFSPIQPQNFVLPPNGLSSNVPPFMQQNFIQQPFQNPQFNAALGQMFPGTFVQGVPPNFGAFASWPLGMPQNNFNHSQVGPPMVFSGLPQGVTMPNQLQMENNNVVVRPFVANGETSQNPNQGNGFSNRGGRKQFQRGGGRFRGGRSGPRPSFMQNEEVQVLNDNSIHDPEPITDSDPNLDDTELENIAERS